MEEAGTVQGEGYLCEWGDDQVEGEEDQISARLEPPFVEFVFSRLFHLGIYICAAVRFVGPNWSVYPVSCILKPFCFDGWDWRNLNSTMETILYKPAEPPTASAQTSLHR